jgi:hypothetical protein
MPRLRNPADQPATLAVELVDVIPFGDRALVRVAGRWSGADRESQPPILFIDDGMRRHRFAALPSPTGSGGAPGDDEPWRAAFSVPSVLVEIPEGSFALEVDGVHVALGRPAQSQRADASGPAPAIVDRAVLAERRSRRAELAEEAQARRAAEARAAAAGAQAELVALERRLDRAGRERLALEARLAQARRAELLARQGAEASERTRVEALEEAGRAIRALEAERDALRAQLETAADRIAQLERELDAARRRGDEAEQAAAAALAARRRAERAASDAGAHSARVDAGTAARLAGARAEAQESVAAARREIERHAGEARALRAQLDELVPQVERGRAAISAADERAGTAAAARAEAQSVSRELERRVSELEAVSQERDRAAARARQLEEQAHAQTREIERARRAEAEAGARLRAVEADSQERLRELRLQTEERLREVRARSEQRLRAVGSQAPAPVERGPDPASLDEALERLETVEHELAAAREAAAAAEESHARHSIELMRAGERAVELERTLTRERRQREELEPQVGDESDAALGAESQAVEESEPEPAGDLDAEVEAVPQPAPKAGPRAPDPRWLPRALVALAAEDPRAAAHLIVQLLPAQHIAVKGPLGYDITVDEVGTHRVLVGDGETTVVPRPEGPDHTEDGVEFALSGTAAALAALAAGEGALRALLGGRVRMHGRRRRARRLTALARRPIGLPEVARAGVRLDPGLIYRALACAVDPEWTRGETFCVENEIWGPGGGTWYVCVDDGAPLLVTRVAPPGGAVATVRTTAPAFQASLAGQAPPGGERVTVRGDLDAVRRLGELTDWAQRGGPPEPAP